MIDAIIIDDEEDGRKAVAMAVARYAPDINIVAICETPSEGIDAVRRYQPQLLFLDIQMPEMSGFEVLSNLKPIRFEVIFVSAYDKHALKAIKFSALDYLLKPIDPEELITAIEKLRKKLTQKPDEKAYLSFLHNMQFQNQGMRRIAVPGIHDIRFYEVDDIVFLRADGSYTEIYFVNGKREVAGKPLKDFDSLLSLSGFSRIHHSHLINLNHVIKYIKGEGGSVVLTGNHTLDISRRKKEEFLRLMNLR